MVAGHETREQPILRGRAQALTQGLDQRYPAHLVALVRRPLVRRGLALPEIVDERREPGSGWQGQSLRRPQGQKDMFAGIDLGVMARRLGYAP